MLKRDKNAPVLYELIRNRQGSPPTTSQADDEQSDGKTSARAGAEVRRKPARDRPAKPAPAREESEAELDEELEQELEDDYEEVDALDDDEEYEYDEYDEEEDDDELEGGYGESEDEDEDAELEDEYDEDEEGAEYELAEDDEESGPLARLSPGQAVRIPVGYIAIGVAVVAIVVVGAYVAGYKKREALAEAERRAEAERQLEQTPDPLVTLSQQSGTAIDPVAPRSETRRTEPAPARPSGPRLHVVDSRADDPRQPGLNYLVVATLPEDEARRAAEFLVSRGLEIALVSVNNRSARHEVVVLQGLTREQFRQAQGTRLEQLVGQLGREYRRDHRGIEFYDVYWKKYTAG